METTTAPHDPLDDLFGDGVDTNAPRRPSRRRTVLAAVLWAITALVIGLAAWVLIAVLSTGEPPKPVKETVGQAITQVKHAATKVSGGIPTVTLSGRGGQPEVDQCTGDFVEMLEYEEGPEQLPKTYSAHNGCKGDVILPLGVGDRVDVIDAQGEKRAYTVVDERRMPQHSTTTRDIAGMRGDFLLQTCFWDDATMLFVGVVPASGATAAAG